MSSDGGGGALAGCRVALEKPLTRGVGELIGLLAEHGGEWSANLTKATTHVVSGEWSASRRAFKVGATRPTVAFVTEQWLDACVAAGS
eukprot:CAMPEP_0198312004 /NCGR_PEP_ID=MMETSP1450-20131203/3555_1 /TAXON_ID=753684 ORGANISM="Madagascaria erythrocladiodes, Strain CCMP3234" /NCGR_SAMPLE_ID=MMETSP1450 /ASSEMBLY_ACC=CAM_ASM_001115 /LENGTH=87 /DNA_ID=CAMNT_0044014929 /DNA_START=77 /DNA_END=336 /DNA_ORIENTATION=+